MAQADDDTELGMREDMAEMMGAVDDRAHCGRRVFRMKKIHHESFL
jgi:hypothetical protein